MPVEIEFVVSDVISSISIVGFVDVVVVVLVLVIVIVIVFFCSYCYCWF